MEMIKFPSSEHIDDAIKNDDSLLIAISFDGTKCIIGTIDEAVEHHILLTKIGLSSLDIDKYFRIIVDKSGADWTFVCPINYKNISDVQSRIKNFYNDGFTIISSTLSELGYIVGIDIPKRYRRHLDQLNED